MAVDPRIAMSFQAPQIASPMELAQNAFALKGAMQQNALAEAKMAEMQRQQQSQNALRQLFAGGKMPDAAAVYAVDPTVGAEYEAKQVEIERNRALGREAGTKADVAYWNQQRDTASRLNDQQSWSAWRGSLPAEFQGFVPQQFTPENKRLTLATADAALKNTYQQVDYGGGGYTLQIPEMGGRASRVAGSEYRKTLSPDQAADNARQAQAEADKVANVTAPLPPKEKQKLDVAYPKASAALRSATNEIDTLVKDLKALSSHPGLSGITGGIEGRLPSVSKNSTAAQALLNKIVARGQFRELQNLRNASPTGGALGSISDRENQALRAAFGAFDQTQGVDSFKQAITDALSQLEFAKGNIQQTFDDTYAYRQGAAPTATSPVAPSAAAIQHLIANPSLAAAFDQKYGAGASSAYLSKGK